MRVIIIKQATDLQALTAKLVGRKSGSATLERVKALNPHVDFNHIQPGTAIMLPDAPDLKASDKDAHSVGDDSFEQFTRDTLEGFKAAAERVRTASDAAAADRAAVTAVLKTAVAKRQVESDPLLRKQLDEVAEESAAEQKRFKDAARQVEVLQKAVAEELAVMGKLLS